MLYQLMQVCRNYFPVKGAEVVGNITISNGSVSGLQLLSRQYFIVKGSILNDGLHRFGDVLTDESFNGAVIPLAVPKAFAELAERVDEWCEKNGKEASAFSSESFSGYSYSRATGNNGMQMTWKDAFATEIAIWRRL